MKDTHPLVWVIPVYIITRAILHGIVKALDYPLDMIFLAIITTFLIFYFFGGDMFKQRIIRIVKMVRKAAIDGTHYILSTPRAIADADRKRYRDDRLSILKQGAYFGTAEHKATCRRLLREEFGIEIEAQE